MPLRSRSAGTTRSRSSCSTCRPQAPCVRSSPAVRSARSFPEPPAPAIRSGPGDMFPLRRTGGYSVIVIDETLLDAMEKMDKAAEHVQTAFGSVRTGRAAPALVERLLVDYYGAPVPLQ